MPEKRLFQKLLGRSHSPTPQSETVIIPKTKWLRVSVEYGQSDGFHFACSKRLAMAIGTLLVPLILWIGGISLPYTACLVMTEMGTEKVNNNLCYQIAAPAAPLVEDVLPQK